MSRTISVGILGCGRVVENRLAEVFEREVRGIKVMAVCDKNPERVENIARRLGAEPVRRTAFR